MPKKSPFLLLCATVDLRLNLPTPKYNKDGGSNGILPFRESGQGVKFCSERGVPRPRHLRYKVVNAHCCGSAPTMADT